MSAADRFFTSRDGLFDAMPAVWKHMSVEQRREICALVDPFMVDGPRIT